MLLIKKPFFSLINPPIIGPRKSPILTEKLYNALDISCITLSSIFLSIFFIFSFKIIIIGTSIGAPQAPKNDKPNITNNIFFGNIGIG